MGRWDRWGVRTLPSATTVTAPVRSPCGFWHQEGNTPYCPSTTTATAKDKWGSSHYLPAPSAPEWHLLFSLIFCTMFLRSLFSTFSGSAEISFTSLSLLFWHRFRSMDICRTMLNNHKLPFLVHLLDDFFVISSMTLLPPPGIMFLRLFGVVHNTELFQASSSVIISGSTSTSVIFLLCAASQPYTTLENPSESELNNQTTSFRSWANGPQKSISVMFVLTSKISNLHLWESVVPGNHSRFPFKLPHTSLNYQ